MEVPLCTSFERFPHPVIIKVAISSPSDFPGSKHLTRN